LQQVNESPKLNLFRVTEKATRIHIENQRLLKSIVKLKLKKGQEQPENFEFGSGLQADNLMHVRCAKHFQESRNRSRISYKSRIEVQNHVRDKTVFFVTLIFDKQWIS